MSLLASELHNEKSFYSAFLRDLESCEREIIIESPYITASRMEVLYPVFEKLLENGIKIHIITRDPIEHEDDYMRNQSTNEILRCTELGINVVMLNGLHHRKLAMIDRNILWEGSLNILSQTKSLEVMRRMENKELTKQMFQFLDLSKHL